MKFWNLRHLESSRGYGNPASWDKSMAFEKVTCPLTEDHMGTGDRVGDLAVELPSLKIGDFVWTWYSECLIQDHVLHAFRNAGFTGFDIRPVKITKVRGSTGKRAIAAGELPKLWELIVTGWAGEAADSGIRMTYYCEGCGHVDYTACTHPEYLIDPQQWDGSDFLIVWPLPKFIFVTDRVAEFIRAQDYKGARLATPVEAVSVHPGFEKFGGFAPGRPPAGRQIRGPEAFPEAKVQRLSEPYKPKSLPPGAKPFREITLSYTIREWLEKELGEDLLSAIIRIGDKTYLLGDEQAITDEVKEFLTAGPKLTELILKEWPFRREVRQRPEWELSGLFDNVQERACVWVKSKGKSEPKTFYVTRAENPKRDTNFFLSFARGVTVGQIEKFQEERKLILPDDLFDFYSTFAFLKAGALSLHEGLIGLSSAVLGIDDAQSEWKDWAGMYEEMDVDKSERPAFQEYLPLYANGFGDFVLWHASLNEDDPEVWYFSHDELTLTPVHDYIGEFYRTLVCKVYQGQDEYYNEGISAW